MYSIEEIFSEDGYDLQEILKSCLYKYYISNNLRNSIPDDLQKTENDANLDITSKEVLL